MAVDETPALSIRLERCGKTFADGTRALELQDLEIRAGETVVFLGPSGCGKTTMLRLVAGLEAPDAGGRVLFNEEDVTPLPIEKRNVGMVFQSYALFPNMNVADNVGYGLRVRKLDAAERRRRVGEMLEMMHLAPFSHRSVDQLSGGQRQRVALARALAVRPRALLLDEPLTALDAKLRDGLRVEIDRLLRELGITAIYVTHDQAEAMALGDRIAVMEKGRIAQIGTPREIYCRPATGFVADFVGTMNRLRGTAGDGVIEVSGGRLPWNGAAGENEVLFRPESVRVVEEAGANLHGRVVAAFFLGDHTRLVVDCGGEQPVVVRTSDPRAFREGEKIGLAVEAGALLRLAQA
jgi:putative spermidine/putrescine transport system ATP-binding protein